MITLTDAQILALIESGGDWEKMELVLCDLSREELVYLLEQLNNIIEAKLIAQYARLNRENE